MGPDPGQRPVGEIMVREPATVGMDVHLWRVRDLMRKGGFQHVLVEDEDGKLVGVVSDRDVLAALSPVADNPRVARSTDIATLEKRVHQVMGRNLLAIAPEVTVAEAGRLLLDRGFHSLPVVDGGHCVGIVTTTDLLRAFVEDAPAAAAA
ncbi:MAG: CBS domain-containing protein [Thermoleophilia bacterium]